MGEPVKKMADPAGLPDAYAGPTTDTERLLSEVLADVVGVERVPVDSHFFDELGADSLVMAHFCGRVRKREGLPSVSMKDVYGHPTIRGLATALTAAAPTGDTPAPVSEPAPATTGATTPVGTPVGTPGYVLCGILQLLAVLAYSSVVALVVARVYGWVGDGSGLDEVYLRLVVAGGAVTAGLCAFPVAAKWLLVGRWGPREIRVWSLAYVRFWVVKTLVRYNPLVLAVGTPLYALYLRALGAKIGPGALVLSRHVPVCTDLLTVGAGAVIRKDSFFTCYRAEAGVIQTGAVTIGDEAVVGEAAVLDIDTSMGDRARLGHSSSLQAGQSVPDGERWDGFAAHGRTGPDHQAVERLDPGRLRPAVYTLVQLLAALLVYVPLSFAGAAILVAAVPPLSALLGPGAVDFASWTVYRDAALAAGALYAGFLLVTFLYAMTVPRVLNLFIEPDRSYRLYGFHYWAHRTIERATNPRIFPRLLGDSSYIVHYLRWLGYDLSEVEQTGSNFGLEVKHENPYLCAVGRGTMVADGLSIINADFSGTSFRLARTAIGSGSFLGNYIAYPPEARTGDDCLLATKLMVPVDGEVREGVGLLGAPSFEIPRSVRRDDKFDHLGRGDQLRKRLAAKNRHNAGTIALYLLSWWLFLSGAILLFAVSAELSATVGAWVFGFANVLALASRIGYFALVERAATLFRPLRPLYCSIYDPDFWRHERFWKLATQPLILDGTPFKNLTWRLMGVRLGRRVFDDGCAIVEKTMTTIGDDCTLNVRSIVQAHSQEDGAFKSDHISIGAGCTLGVGSLVHYGVTMGDGAVLAPDSFLMKGEEIPERARWGGNPAREIRSNTPVMIAANGGRSL